MNRGAHPKLEMAYPFIQRIEKFFMQEESGICNADSKVACT